MIICVINCHPTDPSVVRPPLFGWMADIRSGQSSSRMPDITSHLGLDSGVIDCDSHVSHPPSVNPSRARDSYLLLKVCKNPSILPITPPSVRHATPPMLRSPKMQTGAKSASRGGAKKGRMRGVAKSIGGTPVSHREGEGRGGETPFNADRPRQPVGRSVGRSGEIC